jgi:hypothetical protein
VSISFFVLADRLVMLGLTMMMCSNMVVRSGELMVFTRRMMLRFLRH